MSILSCYTYTEDTSALYIIISIPIKANPAKAGDAKL
jgi:hypothetical protein